MTLHHSEQGWSLPGKDSTLFQFEGAGVLLPGLSLPLLGKEPVGSERQELNLSCFIIKRTAGGMRQG